MKRNPSLFLLVLAISLVYALVAFAGEAKETYTFPVKKGTVTLTHKKHTTYDNVKNCKSCHHEAKEDGSDAKTCKECHKAKDTEKDGKKVLSAKNAAHKQCKDCHKKAKKGPKKCEECHVKAK